MQFRVVRTSLGCRWTEFKYKNEAQPHERTKKRVTTYTEDTPGIPQPISAWWVYGREHRTEGDTSYREVDFIDWILELNSLDELTAFIDGLNEEVVIEKAGGEWQIEIYDTYRE